METINHECYVSLEVAKLLKKAGFDWECRCYYSGNFLKSQYEGYPKPTLDIAQKWLREVKNIDVFVLFEHFEPKIIGYTYEIRHKGTRIILSEWVNTIYEVAQEVGIKKALEIILNKGE